jgi:hypothetical protein
MPRAWPIPPLLLALGAALASCCRSPPEPREREASTATPLGAGAPVLPSAGAAASSSGPREPVRRPWVELYYPSWTMTVRSAGSFDLSSVSDLVLFGLVPDGRSASAKPAGLDEQRVTAARSAARASGASVLVCVGGERTGERFRDAVGADGAALAASVAAFVREHELDGVVLDVEPMSAVAESALVAFVTALRERLRVVRPDARVEAVVAPDAREIALLAPIATLLDRVAVMSYLGRSSDEDDQRLVDRIVALGISRERVGLGIDARTPEERSRRRAAAVRDGQIGGLILWHAGSLCKGGDGGARCALAVTSLVP